jgi:hypothetical protein
MSRSFSRRAFAPELWEKANSEARAANGFHSHSAIPYSHGHETSREDRAQVVVPTFTSSPSQERKISEAKRRQTQGFFCRALRTRPRLNREAHIYRRSTAVLVPRSLSSQGTQPQAMLPGTRRTGLARSVERVLPAPICPQSSNCTLRPSRSARGRDAQSRPGAGCKSARGRRPRRRDPACLPGRVRLSEVWDYK